MKINYRKTKNKLPQYDPKIIDIVVGGYLSKLKRHIGKNNDRLDLNIPKFGRVHTHGNAKALTNLKNNNKKTKKYLKKKHNFSKEYLLF